jgi:hypothetical protein
MFQEIQTKYYKNINLIEHKNGVHLKIKKV